MIFHHEEHEDHEGKTAHMFNSSSGSSWQILAVFNLSSFKKIRCSHLIAAGEKLSISLCRSSGHHTLNPFLGNQPGKMFE